MMRHTYPPTGGTTIRAAKSPGELRSRSLKMLLSGILAIAMFFPLYAVLVNGFKTNGQILADPFGLPSPFTLESYGLVLGRSAEFWIFLYNSVFIAAFTIAIVLFLAMTAAFAFSRMRFSGRKLLYNFFILGLLFPLTVAILPLYLQLRDIGLLGSAFGVILAQSAFALPLSIFIFHGFFREIPGELQDACSIDGGGHLTFLFRVVMPISTPVISTVSILTLIQSWNQFLLPLLVLDDSSKFTIPLGIMQFQGQFTSGWNQIMAFISLSIIPMILFYLFAQKFIVAGLTAGAVKG